MTHCVVRFSSSEANEWFGCYVSHSSDPSDTQNGSNDMWITFGLKEDCARLFLKARLGDDYAWFRHVIVSLFYHHLFLTSSIHRTVILLLYSLIDFPHQTNKSINCSINLKHFFFFFINPFVLRFIFLKYVLFCSFVIA